MFLLVGGSFRNSEGGMFVVGASGVTAAAFAATTTTTTRKLDMIHPNEQNHRIVMIPQPIRQQRHPAQIFLSDRRDVGRQHFHLFSTNENENEGDDEMISVINEDDTRKGYNSITGDDGDDDERYNDDGFFPSLDIVLEKARRRRSAPMMMVVYQIRAFFDGPFIDIPVLSSSSSASSTSSSSTVVVTFTRFDVLLVILAAVILQVPGFALGWVVGKLTLNFMLLQRFLPVPVPAPVVIFVQPFWPFLWAVVFDQITSSFLNHLV